MSGTTQHDETASAPRMPPTAANPALPVAGAIALRPGATDSVVGVISASIAFSSPLRGDERHDKTCTEYRCKRDSCDAAPNFLTGRRTGRDGRSLHAADARRARRPHRLQSRDGSLLRADRSAAAATAQRRRPPPLRAGSGEAPQLYPQE